MFFVIISGLPWTTPFYILNRLESAVVSGLLRTWQENPANGQTSCHVFYQTTPLFTSSPNIILANIMMVPLVTTDDRPATAEREKLCSKVVDIISQHIRRTTCVMGITTTTKKEDALSIMPRRG
ncbi:MAG: hypothetical protein WC805_02460 [Patescibacteria group bacterium]